MFSFLPSKRSARPVHCMRLKEGPGATVEGLEARVHFTFNAYIAGLAGGSTFTTYSFTLSTTGQAAKHWDVNWGDGNVQPFDAPNQVTGWTDPFTVTHQYDRAFDFPVSGTATSITNVAATAVLQENSAFNNNTGKVVQGLNDAASVGTNIAAVVDENNNAYVLSIDGKRFAVTRFKPDGTLDTGTSWKSSGTYVADPITLSTVQDTPKAMAIDTTNHYIYCVGTSNNKWAAVRINYNFINTTPEGWHWADLTGSATAVWLDSTDSNSKIGIAGTNSSAQIQMAMLWTMDGGGHTGGTLNTLFASPNGYAAVPNSIYAVPAPYVVTASASAIFEADDVGFRPADTDGEEWFISGTVDYCCVNCTPSHGSDMVIVDFLEDTGSLRGSPWGNGNGAALFNTCNSCNVFGPNSDSNYAMVPSLINGTWYVTLAGGYAGNTSVLVERYIASTGQRDQTYGPLKDGSPTEHQSWAVGPSGTAYAAVLDTTTGVNKVVISGSGGSNDFLAARFNNDGTLDGTFGQSGSIKIDFGTTSGITTDGGRTIVMRTLADGSTDILVGGYTYDAGTQKYKIALVDLLDDNMFHVT